MKGKHSRQALIGSVWNMTILQMVAGWGEMQPRQNPRG